MSNSGKLLKIASLIMITLACFFVCLHFLYWYDNKYTAKGLQPVSGMLCLSEEDLAGRQLYFLTRQWQFYPDVLLTPEDFKGKTPDIYMRYITIGEYNNFSMDNPARSTRGSATYRLLLSLPGTPRSYTLALPEIFSSYSLYIGGEKYSSLGIRIRIIILPVSETVLFPSLHQELRSCCCRLPTTPIFTAD